MWQSNSVTQLVNTFVGKRANLQTVITKKHAKFPEKENFLLPDTHKYLCALQGGECLFFGKLGEIPCYPRFEIRPFPFCLFIS